jgi:hypothetical protein
MEIYGVYNLQCDVRMVLERIMRWPAHVACVGWKGDPHRVLVEKPEGKSHLGRPMRRLYCIKMNFKERRMDSYGPGCRSQRDYRDLSDDSYYGMWARRLLVVPHRPAAHFSGSISRKSSSITSLILLGLLDP